MFKIYVCTFNANYWELNILLPNIEPAQNLSKVTNTLKPFVYIFWQVLWSMYGKDDSNKTGIRVPSSIFPQPTTYWGIKQINYINMINV